MKLSKFSFYSFGALLLTAATGCAGEVQFNYVLLQPDAVTGQIVAANSCADVGVDSVRLILGGDNNNNGTLDDNEIQQEVISSCNQLDANQDGIVDQGEFGLLDGFVGAGFYDLFAVEFLDAGGNAIPWQTFDNSTNFTRFSFGAGVGVSISGGNVVNIIPFNGDAQQTDSGELQSFFGF